MKQLEFKTWGGRRKGAGRKKTGNVRHAKRERVDFGKPLHITKRLQKGLRGITTQNLAKEFTIAMGLAKKKGLNVLEFAILTNHVHLIVEAKDNRALGRGMNSLWARFGRTLRKKFGGKGPVFGGRYHMKIIRSARQMRNTLEYVLLNESKHRRIEPEYNDLSSARYFAAFGKLLGRRWYGQLSWDGAFPRPDYLAQPRSWLAREGWRRVC